MKYSVWVYLQRFEDGEIIPRFFTSQGNAEWFAHHDEGRFVGDISEQILEFDDKQLINGDHHHWEDDTWEPERVVEDKCFFCNKNLLQPGHSEHQRDYVVYCKDCPFEYSEVSYMVTHYSFTVDKYRVSSVKDYDPIEDAGDGFCTRIEILQNEKREISKRIIPLEHFSGTYEEVLEKVKDLIK